MNADEIIKLLGLSAHPEGGWYAETYRHEAPDGGRGACTAIYFLLKAGECSHWHRVTDADEMWHWYAGGPLALTMSPNGHDATAVRLGPNLKQGERPQILVPAGHWQAAEILGEWTLVGCTVAPAFLFENFELAPPDWRPTPRTQGGVD